MIGKLRNSRDTIKKQSYDRRKWDERL